MVAPQWWGPVPYFTPGRQGTQVDRIVLHTMAGTAKSADAWFKTPGRGNGGTSATYGVTGAGGLVQWVLEMDTAWANGDWGMNLRAISIEHEDDGQPWAPRPDALYATSAQLVADVCRRYSFPCDPIHVIPHHEACNGCTQCPDGLDVARIISQASALLAPPVPPSAPISEDDSMTFLLWHKGGSYLFWEGKRSAQGLAPQTNDALAKGGIPQLGNPQDDNSSLLNQVPTFGAPEQEHAV